MPLIQTKYFGGMEYEEESRFEFPLGLPAFEDQRSFVLIEGAGTYPLVFLQSISEPGLCFIALPVLVADPLYELSISLDDLEELGFEASRQPAIGQEALVLVLLSTQEGQPATANLLAPIVINLTNRKGLQAIRDDFRYSHQHPLFMGGSCGDAAQGAAACNPEEVRPC